VSRSAEIVAWSCFFVGVVLLFAGVVIGLYLTFWRKTQEVKQKVEEAKSKVEELKQTAMSGSMKATDEGRRPAPRGRRRRPRARSRRSAGSWARCPRTSASPAC
jgi:hypothetical protein